MNEQELSGVDGQTVGVAIAVPEPYGSYLRERRASFGDPEAHRIPPHITILPPTLVADRCRDDVVRHLERVAASSHAFTVHLRGTASFRPVSPVVFVQLVAGIAECERLERAVRTGALERDLAFYYHPHVTVAHHLTDEQLDLAVETLEGFECAFEVTELQLYEHGEDGVWRPHRSFTFGLPPLTAPASAPSTRARR
ncbi:MAG TPA: 2'-5' RNA ligase family protein [Actinomycetales bacterium]|nr:2'-5' RNA ligase family protein [Actinomycetales bacterium]